MAVTTNRPFSIAFKILEYKQTRPHNKIIACKCHETVQIMIKHFALMHNDMHRPASHDKTMM